MLRAEHFWASRLPATKVTTSAYMFKYFGFVLQWGKRVGWINLHFSMIVSALILPSSYKIVSILNEALSLSVTKESILKYLITRIMVGLSNSGIISNQNTFCIYYNYNVVKQRSCKKFWLYVFLHILVCLLIFRGFLDLRTFTKNKHVPKSEQSNSVIKNSLGPLKSVRCGRDIFM